MIQKMRVLGIGDEEIFLYWEVFIGFLAAKSN
jgi:hypothetical protein